MSDGSNAQQRKSDCGYVPANRRTDTCAGCAHMGYQVRDPDTAYERRAMHCGRNNIPVSHGSICEDWRRAK